MSWHPAYQRQDAQSIAKYRCVLAVPLMREGIPIGCIALFDTTPKTFTAPARAPHFV
jgi:hypothetical protein